MAVAQSVSRNVSASEDVSNERITESFSNLESDSYETREQAVRTLRKAGLRAVPELAGHALFGKPESASRCGGLLTEIALSSSEADMSRVGRVLNLLASNGCEHLGGTAREIQNLWKQKQIADTVAMLEKVGFRVIQLSRVVFVGALDNSLSNAQAKSNGSNTVNANALTKPVAECRDMESLRIAVSAIVSASNEENLKLFSAEVVATTQNRSSVQQATDMFDESVHSLFNETDQTLSERTSFAIFIDQNTQLNTSAFDTLTMLPHVDSITVEDRDLDDDTLKGLNRLPNINSVTLVRCQYQLKAMFEWVAAMPNAAISASGNKAFLGVQTQIAAYNGEAYQCLVEDVVVNTAAEEAGLEVGDVIESIDGVKIRGHSELVLAIGTFKPKDTAKLMIQRDGESFQQEVTFKERPDDS